MLSQRELPSTESMDYAFCILVDAGATLAEAWDYAPRIGQDWRVMVAYTPQDAKLDLDMWRRESRKTFAGRLREQGRL